MFHNVIQKVTAAIPFFEFIILLLEAAHQADNRLSGTIVLSVANPIHLSADNRLKL